MNMGKSVWVPVMSRKKGITGYIEKFRHNSGKLMSIPGVSRWINGSKLDVTKAVAV